MTLFAFTAIRGGGEKFSGTREAADKQALIQSLRDEGAVALSVEPASSRKGRGDSRRSLGILFSGIFSAPNREKILFARNLSSMIGAGLALSRALGVLEKQTRNGPMKNSIHRIGEEIKQGHSLSEALSRDPKTFSPIFVAMARAGEESGTLADSLQNVATQMEKSYVLSKKVRGAMIYPGIVVTVMIAIGVLMLTYVVPTLAATFSSLNAKLPAPTQFVISMSNALSSHGVFIGLALLIAIAAFVWVLRLPVGKRLFDHVLLATPVIGNIIAKVNAARTARTLSSLLSAGIHALQALEITRAVVQNTRFQQVIAEAHEVVEKGKPFSEAFVNAENIYPVMFSEMAAVGEETGDLAGMLARVADFYEAEVEQETKDLSTIIEPVLMVVIGGGVGFFAIAMIMPIYSLSNAL